MINNVNLEVITIGNHLYTTEDVVLVSMLSHYSCQKYPKKWRGGREYEWVTNLKGGYDGGNLGEFTNMEPRWQPRETMVVDHGGLMGMDIGIHACGTYTWAYACMGLEGMGGWGPKGRNNTCPN